MVAVASQTVEGHAHRLKASTDVTSQMGTALTGDPRDVALRDALYAAIRSSKSIGAHRDPPQARA